MSAIEEPCPTINRVNIDRFAIRVGKNGIAKDLGKGFSANDSCGLKFRLSINLDVVNITVRSRSLALAATTSVLSPCIPRAKRRTLHESCARRAWIPRARQASSQERGMA
jgi:hypothetical protein